MIAPTYYRSQLASEAQRHAYQQVTACLLQRQAQITFQLGISLEDAQRAVYACHMDHAELFFVNFWRVRYLRMPLDGRITAEFEFLLDPKTISACTNLMNQKIEHVKNMVGGLSSPAKKYRKIADLIAADVQYRDSGNALWDHSIVGCLISHQAVCEGLAKLYLLYCQHLLLPCAIVSGEVDSGQKHAWNMIQIGGDTRYVDITSELRTAKVFKHCSPMLFMTEQQAIARGYRWQIQTPWRC